MITRLQSSNMALNKRSADDAGVSGVGGGEGGDGDEEVKKRARSGDAATRSSEVEVLDTCGMLGLSAGDALQVRWELADPESGSCEAIWWDCKLGEIAGTHRVGGDDGEEEDEDGAGNARSNNSGAGGHAESDNSGAGGGSSRASPQPADSALLVSRSLRYAARPPEFPDEEVRSVCFVDNSTVLDLGSDTLMEWRSARALTGSVDDIECSIEPIIQPIVERLWASYTQRADAASQRCMASAIARIKARVSDAFKALAQRKRSAGEEDTMEEGDVQRVLAEVGPSFPAIVQAEFAALAVPECD